MVLYWVHKDSKFEAHTGGPWDVLWRGMRHYIERKLQAVNPGA